MLVVGDQEELVLVGSGLKAGPYVLRKLDGWGVGMGVKKGNERKAFKKAEWITAGASLCTIIIALDKNGHGIIEGTLAHLDMDHDTFVREFREEFHISSKKKGKKRKKV